MFAFDFLAIVLGLLTSLVFKLLKKTSHLLTINSSTYSTDEKSNKHIKIYLLHGRGFNWTEYLPMMYYLKWQIMKRLYTNTRITIKAFNYGDGWLTTGDDSIRQRAMKIFEEHKPDFNTQDGDNNNNDRSQVILIGHSMGGLIAEELTKLSRVVGVITIATPFGGSELLQWILKRGLSKPLPQLTDMCQDVSRQSRPAAKRFNISSLGDICVYFKEGFIDHKVTSVHKLLYNSNVGHYSIMLWWELYQNIFEWLNNYVLKLD